MPKPKHVHVFRSNLDAPADEMHCDCGKVVSVEEGTKHNEES